MTFRPNMRRLVIPLVAIVAIVAVIVPTCQMVGCSGAMRLLMPVTEGLGISGPTDCGGMFVYSSAPPAVPSSSALTLTLLAAIAVLVPALFPPQVASVGLALVRIEPAPPPDDPRGERLLI